MEVSSFRHPALPARSASASLLRLASDERLIALTRRGHQRAFEAIVHRYRARLLAFCRHLLGSREDAEDVLQEVFVAAFNAIIADERPINVRPWLYRIARNRCLNQLRRASATGVDSMDIFLADNGQSVSERILQREQFRSLLADISALPETQRTALLLREIDALPYEQIADVMDTTIPSVKSLLVRARLALAEAAEARALSCAEVREQLGEEAEGLTKLSAPVRRHLRSCDRCRAFRKQLKHNERVLSAVLPVGLFALTQRLLLGHLSSTTASSAGGAYASGSASAAGGAVAGATASTGGIAGLGSLASVGGGAIATKAVAGLAAAALITAGAVAAERTIHSSPPQRPRSQELARSMPSTAAPLLTTIASANTMGEGARHSVSSKTPAGAAASGKRQPRSAAGACAAVLVDHRGQRQSAASAAQATTRKLRDATSHTGAPAGKRPAPCTPSAGDTHAGGRAHTTTTLGSGRSEPRSNARTKSVISTSATSTSALSTSSNSSSSSSSSSSSTAESTSTSLRPPHASAGSGARAAGTESGGETIEVITSSSALPPPAEAPATGKEGAAGTGTAGEGTLPTATAEGPVEGAPAPAGNGGTPAPAEAEGGAGTPAP